MAETWARTGFEATAPGTVAALAVAALAAGLVGVVALGIVRDGVDPPVPPVPAAGMSAPADSVPAARPATRLRLVACEALPNVPGKALTTAIVEFPPGALSPPHRHPGSVAAIVLKGRVRSQLAGGPALVYGPGQSWFEPPGTLHVLAENASMVEPAEILAIFVADQDCGPLVIPER